MNADAPAIPRELDTTCFYYLANLSTGPYKVLSVREDRNRIGLYMGDRLGLKQQFWKLVCLEPDPLKYSLRPAFFDGLFSIDILNDRGPDSQTVHLAATGWYSGQYWTITRWKDGTFRLHNDFTEEDRHLAVNEKGEIMVNDGDDPSQHWVFTEGDLQERQMEP